ncbi:HemK2/MTQ2 family protein methyltransferase [Streptomyces sp. NPDC005538]|uniref:HemK2/MTQ2 family protein methyltransferase n=1 Tax=unclassified Streptomyces TaxID=2593676 RepID=UPI0033A0439E
MATAVLPRPTPSFLLAPPGVYRPQHDTRLLTRALCREGVAPGSEVLDLGTGTGALSVAAARLGARVTAVDISWRAVLTARLNALAARQHVVVHRGDLTDAVPGRSFDLVVSNPPYVPSPTDRLPRRGPARSWDAGRDGRALVDRICDGAPSALRAGGVLLLVHSGLCGTDATLERLERAGMKATVTDRVLIPLGPVLRSRLPWLRHEGLMAEENEEEVVVVRAEHA